MKLILLLELPLAFGTSPQFRALSPKGIYPISFPKLPSAWNKTLPMREHQTYNNELALAPARAERHCQINTISSCMLIKN